MGDNDTSRMLPGETPEDTPQAVEQEEKREKRRRKVQKEYGPITSFGKENFGINFSDIDVYGQKKQEYDQSVRLAAESKIISTFNTVSSFVRNQLEPGNVLENLGERELGMVRPSETRPFQKLIGLLDKTEQSVQPLVRKHTHEYQEKLSKDAGEYAFKLSEAFKKKTGVTPEEYKSGHPEMTTKVGFTEESVPSPEYIEAQNILNMKQVSEDLTKPDPDIEYWNDFWKILERSKEGNKHLKDFFKGFSKDMTRWISEGIGIPSYALGFLPEGEQFLKNNKYRYDYNKLSPDSPLREAIKPEMLNFATTLALMSQAPKERPLGLQIVQGITSSLAALPFYAMGLSKLGLISKLGESGLFTLGPKKFALNLLKSPFYTQPGQMASGVLNAMDNASDYGDFFKQLGNTYMQGLTEVIGEISTPFFVKGFNKFKTFNTIKKVVNDKFDFIANKFNVDLRKATEWLLASPFSETMEEELSNLLSGQPSVYTGDFDFKRILLEATSALGMGLPLGLIYSRGTYELEQKGIQLTNEQKEQFKQLILHTLESLSDEDKEKLFNDPELLEKAKQVLKPEHAEEYFQAIEEDESQAKDQWLGELIEPVVKENEPLPTEAQPLSKRQWKNYWKLLRKQEAKEEAPELKKLFSPEEIKLREEAVTRAVRIIALGQILQETLPSTTAMTLSTEDLAKITKTFWEQETIDKPYPLPDEYTAKIKELFPKLTSLLGLRDYLSERKVFDVHEKYVAEKGLTTSEAFNLQKLLKAEFSRIQKIADNVMSSYGWRGENVPPPPVDSPNVLHKIYWKLRKLFPASETIPFPNVHENISSYRFSDYLDNVIETISPGKVEAKVNVYRGTMKEIEDLLQQVPEFERITYNYARGVMGQRRELEVLQMKVLNKNAQRDLIYKGVEMPLVEYDTKFIKFLTSDKAPTKINITQPIKKSTGISPTELKLLEEFRQSLVEELSKAGLNLKAIPKERFLEKYNQFLKSKGYFLGKYQIPPTTNLYGIRGMLYMPMVRDWIGGEILLGNYPIGGLAHGYDFSTFKDEEYKDNEIIPSNVAEIRHLYHVSSIGWVIEANITDINNDEYIVYYEFQSDVLDNWKFVQNFDVDVDDDYNLSETKGYKEMEQTFPEALGSLFPGIIEASKLLQIDYQVGFHSFMSNGVGDFIENIRDSYHSIKRDVEETEKMLQHMNTMSEEEQRKTYGWINSGRNAKIQEEMIKKNKLGLDKFSTAGATILQNTPVATQRLNTLMEFFEKGVAKINQEYYKGEWRRLADDAINYTPFVSRWWQNIITLALNDAYAKGRKTIYIPTAFAMHGVEGSKRSGMLYATPEDLANPDISRLAKSQERRKVGPFFNALSKIEGIDFKQTRIPIIKDDVLEIHLEDYRPLPLTMFQEIGERFGANPEIIKKATNRLQKLYSEIDLDFTTDEIITPTGTRARGKANLAALSVLINTVYELDDTRAHEYAHIWVGWFRNSAAMRELLKEYEGDEEKLVQDLGKYFTERVGSSRFKQLVRNFLEWVKQILGLDQDLFYRMANDFYNGKLPPDVWGNIIYSDNSIRAIVADARQVLADMATNSIHLIFTDLPYGIDYPYPDYQDTPENTMALIAETIADMRRVAKLTVLTPGYNASRYYPEPDYKFNWHDQYVYVYGQLTEFQVNKINLAIAESEVAPDSSLRGVATDEIVNGIIEETGLSREEAIKLVLVPMKPIRFWSNLLEAVSIPGDTIYDPFVGTGTTLFAAKRAGAGRTALGTDISIPTLLYSKFLYKKFFDVSEEDRMYYEDVKKKYPAAFDKIIDPLQKTGVFWITGSLRLSQLGRIYRANQKPHDIDMRCSKAWLRDNDLLSAPKLADWLTEYLGVEVIPNLQSDEISLYQFIITIGEEKYIVDVFAQDDWEDSAASIFDKKLGMGRLKDYGDFYRFQIADNYLNYDKIVTRKQVKTNRDVLFVFGDNTRRIGLGGQAKEMRGEPNAIGIITKKLPNNDETAFFTDKDFQGAALLIDKDIQNVKDAWDTGKYRRLVVPPIGVGLAKLPEKAPKIYAYLQDKLDELKEYVNHVEPKTVNEGGNIYSGGKGIYAALTNMTVLAKSKGNLRFDYPMEFRGAKYEDAEAAYQANRTGTSKDYDLMTEVITAKLQQYPKLVEEITKNGGVRWLEKCEHKTGRNDRWQGKGRESRFIQSLIAAYESLVPTAAEPIQSESQQEEDYSNPTGEPITVKILNEEESNPDSAQLDKVSQQQDKQLAVRLTTNGILQSLRKETDINLTPVQLLEFVQKFKTGNHLVDWENFYNAWKVQFKGVWTSEDKLPKLKSVFTTLYHSANMPSVKLTIDKDGVVKVDKYQFDAYVDADGQVKSTVNTQEIWQLLQKKLDDQLTLMAVKLINQEGKSFNNFNDTKLTGEQLLQVRRSLMKQGYFWVGIIPNSKTGLLIEQKDGAEKYSGLNDAQLDEAWTTFNDSIMDYLFAGLNTFGRLKRSKALTGTAPTAFAGPEVVDMLKGMTSESAIYTYSTGDKTYVEYRYVVIDSSTIPADIKSQIGDGHEHVTKLVMEVINMLNDTPKGKAGPQKPKYYDIDRYWKWARSIVNPESPLFEFMEKNRLGGIVFDTSIKMGGNEVKVSYDDVIKGKVLDPESVNTHNLLEDSDIGDKGKISKKASGLGSLIKTTLLNYVLPDEAKQDIKAWLEEDFKEMQETIDEYLRNPAKLRDAIVEYANNISYENEVTDLLKYIGANWEHVVKLPSVMEFMMGGHFKQMLFDTVRHFKKGSTPVLIPDLGQLSAYSKLAGANPEAFDENGHIKKGWHCIDYYTAKEKGFKVGDKTIAVLFPAGSFADIKPSRIAAILPREMGPNVFVGNNEEYQDISGKDFDFDVVSLIKVTKGTLSEKVWGHLNKANLQDKFVKMVEDFKDKGKAESILKSLKDINGNPVPYTKRDIEEWSMIAPLVKLNNTSKGAFALNPDFAKLDFNNPSDWARIMTISKEGMINRLYNWKALYTLFLENDYELDGVKANPDINYNIPMLKVLTDMALDWTKQFNIDKIQFNYFDLFKQLFIVPEGFDEKAFEKFQKRISPIRDAFTLTGLKDRDTEKYDYISYYKKLRWTRNQLNTLPKGLGGSTIGITIKGLLSVKLPKIVLTINQAKNVYEKLGYQMLGVTEKEFRVKQREIYRSLAGPGLTRLLRIMKALSYLGTKLGRDELQNVYVLRDYTRMKMDSVDNFALNSIYFDWLNAVMSNVTFKTEGIERFGAHTEGYAYEIGTENNKAVFRILSLDHGKVTNAQSFDNWRDFINEVPLSFYTFALQDNFVGILGKLVSLSSNPVVKQQSDVLLKHALSTIVHFEKFQSTPDALRKNFYMAMFGFLNQIKTEDFPPGERNQIDLGITVPDSPGARTDDLTFKKIKAVSYTKPVSYLINFAIDSDPMAKEVVDTWLENVNSLIEQELVKEQDLSKAEKVLPSMFIPLPLLSMEQQPSEDIIQRLPELLGKDFEQQADMDAYIDMVLEENISGETEKDKKQLRKVIQKALQETDKKYGIYWRIALFNPLVNSHTIPFDVFVDIFGRESKLWRGLDVVYSYPIEGRQFDLTALEVDMKFRHWDNPNTLKPISGAQIWWYIQDSLDRNYESQRVNLTKDVGSTISYALKQFKTEEFSIPNMEQEELEVFLLREIWRMAEDKGFQESLKTFDLKNASVKDYFLFASKMSTDPKVIRTIVGAMRYRYLMDKKAVELLETGIKNMSMISEFGLAKDNLSAVSIADAFKLQLETMLKQVRNNPGYLPHFWDSERMFMDGLEQVFTNQGKTPDEAKRDAKKVMEDIDAETSYVSGVGQLISTFFLKRKLDVLGYMKTPMALEQYFTLLNRLLRFQHLYAMEMLTEDLMENEIPFMKKHAKEMAAVNRGANKYGVKVDVEKLKRGQLILFAKQGEPGLKTGIVKSANKNGFILKGSNKEFSRFEIGALRVLKGTNWLTRAKLVSSRLGLPTDTNGDYVPIVMKFLLKAQAASMLTSNSFHLRNMLGGYSQSVVLYGLKLFSKTKAIYELQPTSEMSEEEREAWNFVRENSIALLGNLDEMMGKFNGMVNVLKEVKDLDANILQDHIRLGVEWNDARADLKELGLRKHGDIPIRLKQFWVHFANVMNYNFTTVLPGLKDSPSRYTNMRLGERTLRFQAALMSFFAHNGLSIKDPMERRVLIAFMDNAVRNTQFLYRVGLDQGMLESSPLARTLFVNYLHYPVSTFTTSLYYFNNMMRQIDAYGVKRVLIEALPFTNVYGSDSESKKKYGKGLLPVKITFGKGTPEERTVEFADINYARVFIRSITIGIAYRVINLVTKAFGAKLKYTTSAIGGVLLFVGQILGTSYTNMFSEALWSLASGMFSLAYTPGGKDKDFLAKIKKTLFQTKQEYIEMLYNSAKYKRFYASQEKKVLESAYIQDLVDDIVFNLPMGVGHREALDAALIVLLTGSLLPENFQEWGVSLANTLLPIRPLRSPLFSLVDEQLSYPLGIGYTPLHTKRIWYDKHKPKQR